MNILIKGALILTQDEKRTQKEGDIYIKDRRIKEVGRGISEKADKIIDGSGCIAIPGLINGFSLAKKNALREMMEGGVTKVVGIEAGWTVLPRLAECEETALKKAAGKKLIIPTSSTRREVFDILKRTKKKPVEYLDSLGLLGKNTLIVDGSWVTSREIKLLAESGTSVCSCPSADLENGTGAVCPISEYRDAGVNVILGTWDSGCTNMFEVMKLAALMQNHLYWKKNVVGPQEVLDFVTVNAAAVFGTSGGRIVKGAAAEIVLLERSRVFSNPLDFLLWGAGPQHIKTIISG